MSETLPPKKFKLKLKSNSPDHTQPPSPLNSETPVVKSETPIAELEAEIRVMKSETPVVESETPVVESETQIVKLETPVVESEIVTQQEPPHRVITLVDDDMPPLKSATIKRTLGSKMSPKKPTSVCKPTKKSSPKRSQSFDKNSPYPPRNKIHNVETYAQKLAYFNAMPCYPQKSREWKEQRNNYLTASTISKAVADRGSIGRRELLLDKVSRGAYKPFVGNAATQWGNKYEPVANGIYEFRNGVEIHEFGMITNDKYPFLGVSPDGILPDRMLEIKCPFSRIIDGHIKSEYYHQMQEQMAVCEYDQCDFLECKFTEICENTFWIDFYDFQLEKGIVVKYIDLLEKHAETDGYSIKFLYSPIELHNRKDDLEAWLEAQIQELGSDSTRLYLDRSYWKTDVFHCQLVYRNESWIEHYFPILQEFWNDVEHYRAVGLDVLLKDIEAEDGADDESLDDPEPQFGNQLTKSIPKGKCQLD